MKNYVLGTVIAAILIAVIAVAGVSQLRGGDGSEAVSYTHLTLPTIYSV